MMSAPFLCDVPKAGPLTPGIVAGDRLFSQPTAKEELPARCLILIEYFGKRRLARWRPPFVDFELTFDEIVQDPALVACGAKAWICGRVISLSREL